MRRRARCGQLARGLSVVAGALLAASTAGAQAPELATMLSCEPLLRPGRVLCAVEVQSPAGTKLSWSDVLVVHAPAFAPPLRSRVAAPSGAGEGRSLRIAIALLASASAAEPVAELRVRARAVVCPLSGRSEPCRPLSREASVLLRAPAAPTAPDR